MGYDFHQIAGGRQARCNLARSKGAMLGTHGAIGWPHAAVVQGAYEGILVGA